MVKELLKLVYVDPENDLNALQRKMLRLMNSKKLLVKSELLIQVGTSSFSFLQFFVIYFRSDE